MREVTHISCEKGTVNIILDSSSRTTVSAPSFRFGSYTELVDATFTQKELERIKDGEIADITFSFVVSDDLEDAAIMSMYQDAVEKNEEIVGTLNKGFLLEVSASKQIGDEEIQELYSLSNDVELQMDLPLYLVRENRDYFFLAEKMGEYELFDDATPDADVLTISTHIISPGMVLYQDEGEGLVEKSSSFFSITSRHLLMVGIVALIILWFVLDRFHRR